MPTEITKSKTRTYIAKRFKDTFVDTSSDVSYIFVGNSIPYANNDTEIPEIIDCKDCDKTSWDNMLIAKKVFPGDVEIVIPKRPWIAGRKYHQYDDTLSIDYLSNDDLPNNTYAMYVLNYEGNVYKCISNGDTISTDEPTGNYTISDGFIETPDGYIWKYMYNIKTSNKFLNPDWMPVPFDIYNSNINTEYGINPDTVIDGSLSLIIVDYPGSGYIHTTTSAVTFSNGSTYLDLPSITNISPNMKVEGVGIAPETYITSTSIEYNRIYLSTPTSGSGGGTSPANNISIVTRVVVEGDGSLVLADATLSGDGIDYITVNTMGVGYSKATVHIYGTSNNAVARAVLPPKYGHGFNAALELDAHTVMVVKRIGDIDASENGLLSTDISFRQYGLLRNPHKYGEAQTLTYFSANNVIAQTIDITLAAGSPYTLNDYVYQGISSSPSFYGYVASQSDTVVKLIRYFGEIDIGSLLTNGAISRPVLGYKNPDLEMYSGDILYACNIESIQRANNQSEEIKLIITV
jgi:hypothetical protein